MHRNFVFSGQQSLSELVPDFLVCDFFLRQRLNQVNDVLNVQVLGLGQLLSKLRLEAFKGLLHLLNNVDKLLCLG